MLIWIAAVVLVACAVVVLGSVFMGREIEAPDDEL